MKKKVRDIYVMFVALGDFRIGSHSQNMTFRPLIKKLNNLDDVLILISRAGKFMRFLRKARKFDDGLLEGSMDGSHGVYEVESSETFQIIEGSRWTPVTIKNFFEREGLRITNFEALLNHFSYKTNHGRGEACNDVPPITFSPKGKHSSRRADA